ncbi:MAG TPA: NADH-quinone oxidoreductase subunit C [Pyrinomonadaceae bacterium]|nr:NADH-quinone oxidoreductase subunit C [Pyrinomonadaceae bacterium]
MADENDKSEKDDLPGVVTPPGSEGTPPTSSIPEAGELAGADEEKAAMIEQAKSRVAAVKESLAEKASSPAIATPPAAGAPKAPVKKKEEGPKPTDASAHKLVKQLNTKFAGAVLAATEFIGQLSVQIVPERIVEVCEFLRTDPDNRFNYLSDLTCVHFPLQSEAPLQIVYQLYSITRNERVRLKVPLSDGTVDSVTSVWPTANWMEREVYDLFGVNFRNHPDLRRILLPNDWEGYPLRKDYPLEFIENAWTSRHLPEMTDVQREQLEQRRAYGLEILSVPQERMMRDIFQGGKEVMPKDK